MNQEYMNQTPVRTERNLTSVVLGFPHMRAVKRVWLAVLLTALSFTVQATSYTTGTSGDINNKENWTPVPLNFTTKGDVWIITLPMTVQSTWAVTGNVTIEEGGSISDNGNTVNFNGHFTNNSRIGYKATGTAVFGSEFPQAIGGTAPTTFNNVTRTNNGLSFNANCIISGDFDGKSFIVDGGNTINFGGNFTVTTGNNLMTGTSVFDGKGAQAISGNPEFYNLTVNNPSGLTLKSDLKVLGNLMLSSGTLADGGHSITVGGNILGSGKESGTGGIVVNGTNATISLATIGNLTLNNATGFTLTGNTAIDGTLTFKAGSLSIGANTLTLNGAVAGMDATQYLTGGEGAQLVIGSTKAAGNLFFNQSVPGTTNSLASLSMTGHGGSATLGSKIVISGTLDLAEGTLADGGNTIVLAGSIKGEGNETGAGGVMMTGAGATISGVTIGRLELNNPAEFTLTGSTNINDALVVTAGSLSIGSNTLSLRGAVTGLGLQNFLTGGPGSNLNVSNNNVPALLFFNQSKEGATNHIATLTIKGTGYSILKLGNKLVSGTALVIGKGQLQLNDQMLELNGTISCSATDNLQGSTSAILKINSKGAIGTLYFDQSMKGNTNNLATLSINSPEGTVTTGSPLNINAELALGSGTLDDGGNEIAVTGKITGTGSETGKGGVALSAATPTVAGVTLNNLTVKGGAVASLNGNLTVNGVMTFAGGSLSIGTNNLTLNGTVAGMDLKNCLTGSHSSVLTVGCKGSLGSVFLDQTDKGNTNVLAALYFVNEGSTVTFASTMIVGSLRDVDTKAKRRK